jgi:dipeptide transport system permease protein
MVFALLIGIPAGVLAAVKRNSWLDHGLMGASLTGYSMPIFWWGLLLILLFSVQLGWTPVSGRIAVAYFIEPHTGFLLIDTALSDEAGAFRSALSHLILPTIVLGTNPLAVIARMTRSAMLEVMGEDYIRTARAKGLPESTVLLRHALANAAVPIVTVIGIGVALLIGGVVVTESVYAIPGLGRLTVDAVLARDFPTIQGVILLFSFVYVMVNLLVDLSYVFFDPRIRY